MTPACWGADPDMFFTPARADEAKAVCARCEVRDACLAGARARGEQHGVWGGVDLAVPDDVMVVAEASTLRVSIPEAHNRARYNAGCRCPICTTANAEYANRYRHEGPAVTRATEINPCEQLMIGVA